MRHRLLCALALSACIEGGGAATDGDPLEADALGRGADAASPAPDAADGMLDARPPGERRPHLVSSATHLTFFTGGPQTLTLTNAGDGAATLTQLAISGDAAFTALVQGLDPRRAPSALADPDADGTPGLSSGAHVDIELRLAPTDALRQRAVLHVISADEAPVDVTLVNFDPATCVDADPPALNWRTRVGATDTREIALRPCLDGTPVTVSGLSIVGDDAARFELAAGGPTLPFTVDAPVTLGVSLQPDRPAQASATLMLQFAGDGPLDEVAGIPLHGLGVVNQCPVALVPSDHLTVPALTVVHLDGTPSIDPDGSEGRPVTYEWVILQRPEGSTSQPLEALVDPEHLPGEGPPDDLTTPTARFFVDLPGRYIAELRVTDDAGQTSEDCLPPTSAQVLIDALPVFDVEVRLAYGAGAGLPAEPPESDLELHWQHPHGGGWFLAPDDCFSANPTPDWGVLGDPSDDPRFETDGPGAPQRVVQWGLEDTSVYGAPYRFAVHAYRVPPGMSVPFTVTVSVRGEVVWTSPAGTAARSDELCTLGALAWPAGAVEPDVRCGPFTP